METAVVTGAAGFVGANLARRLLQGGHETHLFVHPGTDLWRIEGLQGNTVVHLVDLTDEARVRSLVTDLAPDWVFHLAAHGAYPHQTDIRTMIATNLMGTVNLLEAALATGFQAFVNTGSSSEYGHNSAAPGERDWLEPNSNYAVTKAAATLYCRYSAQAYDAPIRTLRLYSVYGPWEEPTRLWPRLLRHAERGSLPPLASPGTARDYVYVDDVADAYLAAAIEPGQESGAVYNIGSGVQTTLAELVDTVRSHFDLDVKPAWSSMPGRAWDTQAWVADPSSARQNLGWAATYDVSSGLKAFSSWLGGDEAPVPRYHDA